MTDHDALLAAVMDRPDDDTPRLVLADWFDDVGQHERAAFIRLQCEHARLMPDGGGPGSFRRWEIENQIYELHRDNDLLLQVPLEWGWPSWVRGFIDRVELPAADWISHGDAVVKAHPVRAVTLTTVPNLKCRYVGDVVRVSLMGDDGRAFVERYTVPIVLDEDGWQQTVAFLLSLRWPRITFTLPPRFGRQSGSTRPMPSPTTSAAFKN